GLYQTLSDFRNTREIQLGGIGVTVDVEQDELMTFRSEQAKERLDDSRCGYRVIGHRLKSEHARQPRDTARLAERRHSRRNDLCKGVGLIAGLDREGPI